jgi:hypothetical protein
MCSLKEDLHYIVLVRDTDITVVRLTGREGLW